MSMNAMPGTRPRSSKLEQAPVEVECGVEVTDLERYVVDANEAGHVSPRYASARATSR